MTQKTTRNHPNYPADDRLARFTFSDTVRAAGLLREFLPAEIQRHLRLEELMLLPEQHISKHLRERRDDLNFSCPLRNGGEALLRILVEHKSAHDPRLWMQLYDSITWHWKKHPVQAVIPVVLHTGPKPFHIDSPTTRLAHLPEEIKDMLPQLPILAIDLATTKLERLDNSPHMDAVAKVILGIFKLAQLKMLQAGPVRALVQRHFPDAPSDQQREYLDAAITYISTKPDVAPETAVALRDYMSLARPKYLAHPIHPRSQFAQELRDARAEGMAKGEAKGEARGEARGKAKGQAKVQAMVANMRQKGLDPETIASLTGLTLEELETLRVDS